jgi:hypothetical protein
MEKRVSSIEPAEYFLAVAGFSKLNETGTGVPVQLLRVKNQTPGLPRQRS